MPYYLTSYRTFLLCLLFLQVSLSLPGQKRDNLTNKSQRVENDSSQVNAWMDRAKGYQDTNPDSSVFYAKQALELSERTKYKKGIIKASNLLGMLAFDRVDLTNSIKYWNKALQIHKELNDSSGMALSYLYLGYSYNNRKESDLDSCRIFFNKAIECYEKTDNHERVADAINGLAISYFYQGSYDTAITMYQHTLEIYNHTDDMDGMGGAYNNIALVYLEKGMYAAALENLHKALGYFQQSKNEIQYANTSTSIGTLYLEIDDLNNAEKYLSGSLSAFEKIGNPFYLSVAYDNMASLYEAQEKDFYAMQYYRKSFKIVESMADNYSLIYSYSNLARVFNKFEKVDTAVVYYMKAIDLAREFNDYGLLSSILVELGEIYLEMGKTGKALQLGKEALDLLESLDGLQRIEAVSGFLSKVYEKTGDYEQAYKYLKIQKESSDSLVNKKNIRTIAVMEYDYELDKFQQEQELKRSSELDIIALERQKDRIAYTYVSIIAIILSVMVIFILLLYRNKKKDNNILSEKNETIKKQNKTLSGKNTLLLKQEQELRNLNTTKDKFFSIMAHDIKNPLTALIGFSELIKNNYNNLEEDRIKEFIDLMHKSTKSLYKLLDNLLLWSRMQRGSIPFDPQEILLADAIDQAVGIVHPLSVEKEVPIHYTIGKELTVYADVFMLNTILRNLLNNALKFTPSGKNVYIETESSEDHIKIRIKDEGIGMAPEIMNKLFRIDENISMRGTSGEAGTGLGLILCKEFVGKNGGEIGVESKENEGSVFWFTLQAIS